MISNALVFAAGVVVGGGLVIANRKSCEHAVSEYRKRHSPEVARLRRENAQLKDRCVQLECRTRSRESYRTGYENGRKDPLTEAERFASTFEGKRVAFRSADTPTA